MEDRPSQVLPREFLCCPMCREEFQEPKYLSCLHSFCKACIDSHINNSCDNNNGYLTCPVCATETLLPEYKLGFPDNTFAKRLSSPTMAEGQRDKTCGQCKTQGLVMDARIHCINCDDFLCSNCALNHLDQEETASHKTQKIEDYEETNTHAASSHNSSTFPRCCKFYDALDIGSTYCVDCELSLCDDCHAKYHNEHRCAELSAISQNFENKIRNPLEGLKKDKNTLHRALDSLENVKTVSSKKQEEVKQAVMQRTQLLCNLIKEYESVLILELQKRQAQNMATILQREGEMQRHIESIKAVTDLTEKLLTFGTDEEKVAMRRQIGRRVRELCEVELPTKHIRLTNSALSEPPVAVETICDMFGVLKKNAAKQIGNKNSLVVSHSIDFGVMSRRASRQSASSTDELTDLEEYEGEDMDSLQVSHRGNELPEASTMMPASKVTNDDTSELSPKELEAHAASQADSSFQSSVTQEDVPCLNLEVAKREMCFPEVVVRDCIKGVGVNSHGDIIVGTVSPQDGSKVYILEKHGIVRGQINVDKNWLIHSIAADGKVSLVMPRSENRYKVKVMSGENNIDVLVDVHIESFGMNSVTATKFGTLLVAANRYATTNPVLGRSPKYGGNITMYDQEGTLLNVITNDTFSDLHIHLFDRPQIIATDHQGNFFVADPGRHSVAGFMADGKFMFEYGNTDAEEELYQGPDAICADRKGNVIVFDKKDGRIDILNYEGHLQRCYFPSEHIRFVCATPDRTLMLVNSGGEMKFFDYT